jgi:hypothetical protein
MGKEKNEIRSAVTPDHRDYAQVMGTAGLQFGGQGAAGHAPQQTTPAAPAHQPSQPASAPGFAGRPSWAQ